MLDPVSIGLVIGGAKALKSAFDTAKEAMDEFRSMSHVGSDVTQRMSSLVKFFSAHGEVKQAMIESMQPAIDVENPADHRSDTAIALEAMQYELRLRDYEEEIKTYLIYECKQPGLYDELCRRRDAISDARAAAKEEELRKRIEARLEEKRIESENRRAMQQRLDIVVGVFSVVISMAACCAMVYGAY